jgi:CBS domain-containing protein
MKIDEVMTRDVKTCNQGTNLAEAGALLLRNDCGALPVVNDQGKITGMISDRDICIALITKNRLASDIPVWEVISGQTVYSCTPEQTVDKALALMQERQVRRLPVTDAQGNLQGVLSINDLILIANGESKSRKSDLAASEVLTTLKAICAHRTEARNAATQKQ